MSFKENCETLFSNSKNHKIDRRCHQAMVWNYCHGAKYPCHTGCAATISGLDIHRNADSARYQEKELINNKNSVWIRTGIKCKKFCREAAIRKSRPIYGRLLLVNIIRCLTNTRGTSARCQRGIAEPINGHQHRWSNIPKYADTYFFLARPDADFSFGISTTASIAARPPFRFSSSTCLSNAVDCLPAPIQPTLASWMNSVLFK
jgi:hypothetical protein